MKSPPSLEILYERSSLIARLEHYFERSGRSHDPATIRKQCCFCLFFFRFVKSRYKQKYTWAQLPWIQIGVQQSSLTLLMDIVTMKLPPNALIFLTALGVEFNVNFLNRCRVNALSGEQASKLGGEGGGSKRKSVFLNTPSAKKCPFLRISYPFNKCLFYFRTVH